MSAAKPSTTTTTPDHRGRSPLLGEPGTIELDAGQLELFEKGEGPPIVFAHGWLASRLDGVGEDHDP